MHAVNALRESGAVVSIEDYRRACDERDAALADVARLTAILGEREPDMVTAGDLSIDMKSGLVWHGAETIAELTATERAIIRCLSTRGGPMTHAEIDLAVWGGTGDFWGHKRVRVNVHRIRQKIGADAIRTIRGVGVMLR